MPDTPTLDAAKQQFDVQCPPEPMARIEFLDKIAKWAPFAREEGLMLIEALLHLRHDPTYGASIVGQTECGAQVYSREWPFFRFTFFIKGKKVKVIHFEINGDDDPGSGSPLPIMRNVEVEILDSNIFAVSRIYMKNDSGLLDEHRTCSVLYAALLNVVQITLYCMKFIRNEHHAEQESPKSRRDILKVDFVCDLKVLDDGLEIRGLCWNFPKTQHVCEYSSRYILRDDEIFKKNAISQDTYRVPMFVQKTIEEVCGGTAVLKNYRTYHDKDVPWTERSINQFCIEASTNVKSKKDDMRSSYPTIH